MSTVLGARGASDAARLGAVVGVSRWSGAARIGTPALVLLVIVLGAGPFLAGPAALYPLINLFVYLMMAISWNLLAGYGGMVSVGQQAYIGLGAYGLVYLADNVGLSPFLALPLAGALAALVALPVSFLVFRLAGGYFAVGTWVVAEVVRLLTVQVDAVGAGSGTSLSAMAGFDRTLRVALTYWAGLAGFVLVLGVAVWLARSRFGLALAALRDDPTAAASSGVDVARAKRLVFCLGAAAAGLAGGIVALRALQVQPDSIYSVQWTAFMIFMVVIGGVGTMEGPLIGAVIFFVLQQTLAQYGSTYLIILGALAVLIILVAPQGLWGLVGRGRITLFPVGYRARASDRS